MLTVRRGVEVSMRGIVVMGPRAPRSARVWASVGRDNTCSSYSMWSSSGGVALVIVRRTLWIVSRAQGLYGMGQLTVLELIQEAHDESHEEDGPPVGMSEVKACPDGQDEEGRVDDRD